MTVTITDTIVSGDELSVTAEIENTGSVDGEFKVYLYNESGGTHLDTEPDTFWENINAGDTESIEVTTNWGAWDACDMGSTYYVEVKEETEGEVHSESNSFTPPVSC